jgi:hypothetical protein
MAKPKSPEAEAEDRAIVVDILEMEMSQGLPNWLDPIEKYKGKHQDDRIAQNKKRSRALQRKLRRGKE